MASSDGGTLDAMNLSEDQRAALDRVMAWLDKADGAPTLTLGGYAGTGKTTVISALLRTMEELELNVSVCAFTGKAVSVLQRKGVDSQTLHSMIYTRKYSCKRCFVVAQAYGCEWCGRSDRIRASWVRISRLRSDLVIVDESSMLSTQLVTDLEKVARRILYVGDHGQLEPIGDDPGIMREPTLLLERIHRQGPGSDIIGFAHHLRAGKLPAEWTTSSEVSVRTGIRGVDLSTYDAVLCGFNRTRVAINRWIRKKRGHTGEPKVGERLICLQNDSDMGVYNGMMVIVREVRSAAEQDIIRMDFEDDTGQKWLDIPVFALQFNRERSPRSRIREAGVFDYGYALTVHKSQGSEWENIAVLEQISPHWSASRWRYTAATRASQKLDYFLPENTEK